jgi:crotonobetainyl-CoA:carnitine CoA-transferase CaiB-like acyl-CoA transferase
MTTAKTDQHRPAIGALAGVRVLEYGTGVGARYTGSLLAQLGASVDKIAAPAPADTTAAGRLRTEAESIYLDADKNLLDDQVGSAAFVQRFAAADVVLRGYDPTDGEASAIREEYEQWRGDSTGLVFVAVSPFGVAGSGSTWHGGSLEAQSISGWTYITGNPGEAPLSMNYGIGSLMQGVNAAAATIAALLERGNGQGGEFVDVSEADVIAAAIRMYSLTYRFLGIPLKRNGLRAPGSSGRYPHTALPCKDGYISTICRSEQDWNRFLEMMGNPAWGDEPRYRDFCARATEYPDEVDALIVPWLMEHTKDEIAELATHHKVPIAPLRTADEVVEDPQFRYRGFFREHRVGDRTVLAPGQLAHWRRAERGASS